MPSRSSPSRASWPCRALASLLPLACWALAVSPARAAEPVGPAAAAVVELQAQASARIVPDRTVVLLAAVAQGSDVAALNAEVAARIDAALRRARGVAGVEVGTEGISTQPRFSESNGRSQQDGWTVRAQLRLRASASAADSEALARLLGQLGGSLQVESVGTELSTALRQQQTQLLSAQAIAAFRARAQAAARDFGYASWSLGKVQLGELEPLEPSPRPLMLAAMRQAGEAPAGMAVQPGSRGYAVRVSGSVQLQR